MKFSLFTAAVVAMTASTALAEGRFYGLERQGGDCYVDVTDVPTAPTGVIETGAVQIAVGGYRLTGLYLHKNNSTNYSVREELLKENGRGHYSRVVGEPGAVAGLGLLEATIFIEETTETKAVTVVQLQGKGVWRWWKKQFNCVLERY